MSVNSVNSNNPNYDININNAPASGAAQTSSASAVSNAQSENDLMSAEIGESDTSSEARALKSEYQLQVARLQQKLEDIRTEKQRLILQLSNPNPDENGSKDIQSQIVELNSQSNSIYMEMVNALKDYNSSLSQLIQNSLRQKVEEASALQSTLAQGSALAGQSVNAQSSLAGYNAQKGQALASAAHSVDDTIGWCLKGVNDSLEATYGQRLTFEGAYEAIPALQGKVAGYEGLASQFKEVSVSRDELPSLPAGAIVVWDQSPGHQWGHISIALGDGRESSDHIESQITARDAEYHVFIPV